jgi:hypothetical protein
MTRQRRIDSQFSCLSITDFSHHDDIRILTQKDLRAAAKVNPACTFTCTCKYP